MSTDVKIAAIVLRCSFPVQRKIKWSAQNVRAASFRKFMVLILPAVPAAMPAAHVRRLQPVWAEALHSNLSFRENKTRLGQN